MGVLDRVLLRVNADGPCWLWQGSQTSAGYGNVKVDGRNDYVHRLVYRLLVGPIPAGMHLDHLCRVRHCCNPDHLEPVTVQVNIARGAQGAGKPRRTSCRRGHPFTPENTVPVGTRRTCRTCVQASRQRRQEQKRAA